MVFPIKDSLWKTKTLVVEGLVSAQAYFWALEAEPTSFMEILNSLFLASSKVMINDPIIGL